MEPLLNALLRLIEIAKNLGLNEIDLRDAKDYIENNELGLCFEILIAQIYEYGIEINNEFYELISKIGEKMSLSQENYSFMKELIRDKNNIANSIKDELAKIIASL